MTKRHTIAAAKREKQKKIDRLVRAIRSRRVKNAREAADFLLVTPYWAGELCKLAIEQGARIVTDRGAWTIIEDKS